MHVLPLEIQHSVFLLACTDGGRTGRALSLTSRSYRDAVRPVRFHSVAVRAFPHIEGVLQSYKRDLAELEASGSTLKPRVRHLLLSPEGKQHDHTLEEEASAVEDEEYTSSLVALLQLVGPTLETLAYTAQFRFTGLGRVCPMPKLEELTVFLNPRERQSTSLPGPPHPPASYPTLQKLHIVLSWGAVVPDLMGWWAQAAPNVTDVRLTNMGRRDSGMEWVESMIGASDRVTICSPRWRTSPDHQTEAGLRAYVYVPTGEDRAKRPYPNVARLFVEAYQKPVAGKCGTPRAQHRYFMRGLKGLRKKVPADIRFVLKERDSVGKPLDRVADVERYWMDSVSGGPGGWRRPDGQNAAK